MQQLSLWSSYAECGNQARPPKTKYMYIAPPNVFCSAAGPMASSSTAAATKGKGRGKGKGQEKQKSGATCELCRASLPDPSAGGGAEAFFRKVLLTFACASCAEDFISHEGMLLACQTRAMKEFKLSLDDLAVLKYNTKQNPHSLRNPLKLFVRAECEVGVRVHVHVRCWRLFWSFALL